MGVVGWGVVNLCLYTGIDQAKLYKYGRASPEQMYDLERKLIAFFKGRAQSYPLFNERAIRKTNNSTAKCIVITMPLSEASVMSCSYPTATMLTLYDPDTNPTCSSTHDAPLNTTGGVLISDAMKNTLKSFPAPLGGDISRYLEEIFPVGDELDKYENKKHYEELKKRHISQRIIQCAGKAVNDNRQAISDTLSTMIKQISSQTLDTEPDEPFQTRIKKDREFRRELKNTLYSMITRTIDDELYSIIEDLTKEEQTAEQSKIKRYTERLRQFMRP
jgi:hypothetical protein